MDEVKAIAGLGLPSARGIYSDPQRMLYEVAPDSAHRAASQRALSEVCEEISRMGEGSTLVEVHVHSALNSFASSELYLFSLVPLMSSGSFYGGVSEGEPVHVAVLANQPVSVQVESLISFMSQLVERQRLIGRQQAAQVPVEGLPEGLSQADTRGVGDVVDELRLGWQEAARRLARRASSAGIRLVVAYRPAFASGPDRLDARVPLLRRVYNEFDDVRDAIDRLVGVIAGRESRVSGRVPEEIRRRLQTSASLSGTAQHFAQAIRDALVFGNGYVAFTSVEPFGPYNLDPTSVDPTEEDLCRRNGRRIKPDAVHFTGLGQLETRLGLGLCELALSDLRRGDVFADAIRELERFIPSIPQASERVETYRRMAVEHNRQRRERFAKTVTAALPDFAVIPPDLYFEGRELLS